MIAVRRNGATLGPYTVEQVQRMIDDGMLFPADSAAYEGSNRWEPLYSMSGLRIDRPLPEERDAKPDRSLDMLMLQTQMKSKSVAVVLAIFIPFLGVFYSAPLAALVSLLIGAVSIEMLSPQVGATALGLILFSVAYMVSISRALAGVSRHNLKVLAKYHERT